MENQFLQYGVLGAVCIAMAWYVMFLQKEHRKERKEWRDFQEKQVDRMAEQTDESNKVMREHSNLLSGLKTLLENRK